MAQIQNTSDGQRELSPIFKEGVNPATYKFPRSTVDPSGVRTPGVGEIPDVVLDELLASDPFTKAIFASGELVRVSAPNGSAAAAPAPAPVQTPAPEDAPPAKGKGK